MVCHLLYFKNGGDGEAEQVMRQHQMSGYHDSKEGGYIWNCAECNGLGFKGM